MPYLGYHLLLNILTVDAINYFLEWTACQDQLIACCDPFNIVWLPQLGTLAPCMWLVGHTLAYMNAAYTYAGTSWERHANLAVAQVVWFFFEMLTFSHTYAWERITYYNNSEGAGSPFNFLFGGADGHPCPERLYFFDVDTHLAGFHLQYRRPGGRLAPLPLHASPQRKDRARGRV